MNAALPMLLLIKAVVAPRPCPRHVVAQNPQAAVKSEL